MSIEDHHHLFIHIFQEKLSTMDQHISSLLETYQMSRGGILVQVLDCSALNEEETVQAIMDFMQRASTRRDQEAEMEVERPEEELEEGEPSGKKRKIE